MEIRNTPGHLTITMKSGGQCEKWAIWSTVGGRVENRETLAIIGRVGRYGRLLTCIWMQIHIIIQKKLDWHQTKADGFWDFILAKVSKWTVYLHATKAYSSEIHQYCSIIPDVKCWPGNLWYEILSWSSDFAFIRRYQADDLWQCNHGRDLEESANWLCDVSYTAISM